MGTITSVATNPASSSPGSSGLVVSGLRRTFGTKTALESLDLTVPPGSVAALLGPNGSGKSTSMKVIGGVLRPTSGTAHLNGVSLTEDALEFKRRTGLVPDVGGLFPRLTGWEHLELAARLRRLTNWEPRAKELLTLLDLTDSAGLRSSTYSHGMSRKPSPPIALLGDPDLLLLDEPFDGVDPLGTDALVSLILAARDRGASVLVSTHLLDVAAQLAGDVFVVRRGAVVANGSPRDLTLLTGTDDLSSAYRHLLA